MSSSRTAASARARVEVAGRDLGGHRAGVAGSATSGLRTRRSSRRHGSAAVRDVAPGWARPIADPFVLTGLTVRRGRAPSGS